MKVIQRGKTVASLINSRNIRSEFVRDFGLIPTSILRYDRKKSVDPIVVDEGRSYGASSWDYRKKGAPIAAFSVCGQGCKGGALSRFPKNVGELIVKFYSNVGDTVFDPFAGHNSRMLLCAQLGRKYIGVDISKEFMLFNRKLRQEFISGFGIFKKPVEIILIEGSSHNVPQIKSGSVDFTITSPPYWDIEYYGDEEEQLGKCKTYEVFLEMLERHVKENFRVVKEGAFVAWFVNDFIKAGKYYNYHSDLITIFNRVGFSLFSIYIVDLVSSLGACFVQEIKRTKRFPKQHEYCFV